MSGKSKIDYIFTVTQLAEKHYEFDKKLQMLFVNHKRAYDSVNRAAPWNALIIFRIPTKTVKIILNYVKQNEV